jgi:hypothetical protein
VRGRAATQTKVAKKSAKNLRRAAAGQKEMLPLIAGGEGNGREEAGG